MKAVVLAAGKGTRLGGSRPKPMLEVGGRPVLAHTFDLMARSGVTEVFMNLHYQPQALRDYCGSGAGWGLRITYAFEPELLGTAGAVRNFGPQLGDGPFFVVYGDNFIDFSLEPLLRFHKDHRGLASIALYQREDVAASGVVELGSDGRVLRFVEKPRPGQIASRLVNAGVYVLESAILPLIPDRVPCDFGADAFPELVASGRGIYGRVMEGAVWPIDTPELYRRLRERMGDRDA